MDLLGVLNVSNINFFCTPPVSVEFIIING
jgi:hypothetical protein